MLQAQAEVRMGAARLTQAVTQAQLQAEVYRAIDALQRASARPGLLSLMSLPAAPLAASHAAPHAATHAVSGSPRGDQEQQQQGWPGSIAAKLGLRPGGAGSMAPVRPLHYCLYDEWAPAAAPPLQQRRCVVLTSLKDSCSYALNPGHEAVRSAGLR